MRGHAHTLGILLATAAAVTVGSLDDSIAAPPTPAGAAVPPPYYVTRFYEALAVLSEGRGSAAAAAVQDLLAAAIPTADAAFSAAGVPAAVLHARTGWVCGARAAVVRAGITPAMQARADVCRHHNVMVSRADAAAADGIATEADGGPLACAGTAYLGACQRIMTVELVLGITDAAFAAGDPDAAATEVSAALLPALANVTGVAAAVAKPVLRRVPLVLQVAPLPSGVAGVLAGVLAERMLAGLPVSTPHTAVATEVVAVAVCAGGGDTCVPVASTPAPVATADAAGDTGGGVGYYSVMQFAVVTPDVREAVEAAVEGLLEMPGERGLGGMGVEAVLREGEEGVRGNATEPPGPAEVVRIPQAGSTPVFVAILTTAVGVILIAGIVHTCFCVKPSQEEAAEQQAQAVKGVAAARGRRANLGAAAPHRACSSRSGSASSDELAEIVEIDMTTIGTNCPQIGLRFEQPKSALKTSGGQLTAPPAGAAPRPGVEAGGTVSFTFEEPHAAGAEYNPGTRASGNSPGTSAPTSPMPGIGGGIRDGAVRGANFQRAIVSLAAHTNTTATTNDGGESNGRRRTPSSSPNGSVSVHTPVTMSPSPVVSPPLPPLAGGARSHSRSGGVSAASPTSLRSNGVASASLSGSTPRHKGSGATPNGVGTPVGPPPSAHRTGFGGDAAYGSWAGTWSSAGAQTADDSDAETASVAHGLNRDLSSTYLYSTAEGPELVSVEQVAVELGRETGRASARPTP